MKFFSLYFFLFMSACTFSQERNIINGKVYVPEDKEAASGVYVTNKTINHTTITDITGNFTLPAKQGDDISFQSFNIRNRELTVTQTMAEKRKMTVYLDIIATEIEGITISPFKTYGSIELDVKRIPMMNETNKLLAKLGSLHPDRKYDGSTDITTEAEKLSKVKIGIDGILNSISGETKKQERLAAYEKQINEIKEIREYYGDQYFNDIGLKTHEINEFILYTYLDYGVKQLYKYQNYFQILNVFQKTILTYQSRKQSKNTISPKVGGKYFPEESARLNSPD